ncbi:hypothetical protein [Paraburkholderia strydomiana]|uniref:hypothetical protein n=1 Tax=Paraburkholderia strydomiana TaxID=1245417 RepID=UPI001BE83171|nr:hypothetical protein [Paraburkholderia strydomiana]MBT2792740.1 hypothetical protein [Paraburkholderia strydomiana]
MAGYKTDFALRAGLLAAPLRTGATELDRQNIDEDIEALALAVYRERDGCLARFIQSPLL